MYVLFQTPEIIFGHFFFRIFNFNYFWVLVLLKYIESNAHEEKQSDIFIRPFEKRSYYVIPLSVRQSVCKLFRFRGAPPTVYVQLSWNLVYSKAMRWFKAYYLEVMVQRFLAEL